MQLALGFEAVEGGAQFEARHPGVRVRFDGRRLLWSDPRAGARVEIETTSIGRTGRPTTRLVTPAVRLERDGTLAIDHGLALERVRDVEQGVHQTFRFAAAPDGRGALEVRLRVRHAEHAGASAAGHHFASERPGVALTYGAASWIDSTGRRVPIVTDVVQGEIVLRVDEATLESSSYPAEIDPVISARTVLGALTTGYSFAALASDVAFDGTNYLVVWRDIRQIEGRDIGVRGARVGPDGVVLDPGGFSIFERMANTPAVAFDGTGFVVATTLSTGEVQVNRVTTAGVVLDGPSGRTVDTTAAGHAHVDIASSAGVSLVAWSTSSAGFSGGVRARALDASGTPLGATLVLHTSGGWPPAVASDGAGFFVAWRWGGNRDLAGSVLGVRVTASGAPLDVPARAVGTMPPGETAVSVAGMPGTWLVAWRATSGAVAARVSDSGAVLDPTPIEISSAASYPRVPALAAGGGVFYASWSSGTVGTGLSLNRITPDGVVLDGAGTTLRVEPPATSSPSTACGPIECLVAWTGESYTDWTSGRDVLGLRIAGAAPVDPEPVVVSASANQQRMPAIARAGTQYLVVWEDHHDRRAREIHAARVSSSGEVLDPGGFAISAAPGEQTRPAVAGTATGEFFVAWQGGSDASTQTDIYGTRVLADGTVVVPDGVRLTSSHDATEPTLASDGTGYLLAWHDGLAASPPRVIHASRVSADGTMLDAPPLALTSPGLAARPAAAFGGGTYLVAIDVGGQVRGVRVPAVGPPTDAPPGLLVASGGHPSAVFDGRQFVVAFRREAAPGLFDVLAARVGLDGSILDPAGIPLSSTPYRVFHSSSREAPQVAFDGVDSVVTWAPSFDAGVVLGTWLTRDGRAFGTSTLVGVPDGMLLSASIAGAGDGDHSALVYAYGDPTPGVRSFRVASSLVAFRVNGRACVVAEECKSGSCVDGVCCDDACGLGDPTDCQVCSASLGASADGVCTPLAAGTACRAASGECDAADTCDGSSGECLDAFAGTTTTCRASQGACDPEERCSGASPSCPPDVIAPSATVCRASAGGCDLEELCDGSATACPPDAWAASGAVCRPPGGACDVEEVCTGSSPSCPADDVVDSGVVCRPSGGECDVAESCTGTSALCPEDVFASAATECRASARPCDAPERCTGAGAQCPDDAPAPDGESCEDDDVCDGAEICASGACVPAAPIECDDGNPCTADACDSTSGCANLPVAGCCRASADCDDGDACTTDTCSGAGGTCSHERLTPCPDAGVATRDAGVPFDAGMVPSGAGCACRTGASRPTGASSIALPWLVVPLILLRRRLVRRDGVSRRPKPPRT